MSAPIHAFALSSLIALAALGITPSVAADPSPGLWEITMESRVPSDGGWSPSPFSLTQCLTAADARDPSRLVGTLSTPGATGCSYTERDYSGSTFRFAMDCPGSFGIKSRGSVTFSADAFDGNITATGKVGGQVTEFQNRISGRRAGDC